MACIRFSQSVMESCRDQVPGIKKIYIANYGDVVSYSIDATDCIITGMTMTAGTKFYSVLLNKQNAAFVTKKIENELVSTSQPLLTFSIPTLSTNTIKMYNELKQCDTIAVVKTMKGTLIAVGIQNGLAMSDGWLGTDANEFIGAYFQLEGIESKPFYFISENLDFENEFTQACLTGNIDGGGPCSIMTQTLDGGFACTTKFHCEIDAGVAC